MMARLPRRLPSWLLGWQFRKAHEIKAATGAGTEYQVKITVHYGFGVDSDDDVYCGGRCKSDFGDVRFTSLKHVLLDYWMEYKTDSDNAVFWVEIADSLESSAQTIYVYYGNAGVSTTSNIFNTGLSLADDYEDNSLNAKWTAVPSAGDTAEEAGGKLHTICPHSAWHHTRIRSTSTIATGRNLRFRYVAKVTNNNGRQLMEAFYGELDLSAAKWGIFEDGSGDAAPRKVKLWTAISGAWALRWTSTGILTDNTEYIFEIVETGTQAKLIVYNSDGSLWETSGYFNCDDAAKYLHLSSIGYGDATTAPNVYVNWLLHTKYVDPEPTHGAWGSEEHYQRIPFRKPIYER